MRVKIILAAAIAAGAASAGEAQQRLPIQPGFYAYEQERCGRADSLFRYDGRRIGWIRAERQPNEMEPIRRIRRQGRAWQVDIANRDPDPEMNPDGIIPVMITPRGQGRIAVEVQEELPMRLCAAAELPRWTRGR